MGKLLDYTGFWFGKLYVLKKLPRGTHKNAMFLCMCECGKHTRRYSGSNLRRGLANCPCGVRASRRKVYESTLTREAGLIRAKKENDGLTHWQAFKSHLALARKQVRLEAQTQGETNGPETETETQGENP